MGTVRDGETGEPLAAATVTLTDLDRFATADANGRYELFDIPAGPHRVLVRFMGYVPRSLQALVPPSGVLEIHISLHSQPVRLQALEGGEVVQRPESPSGLHVRGGMSDQTAYLIDDVPVFSPYHTAGVFSAWNPDALAAARLQSAEPPPAYGRALAGADRAQSRP